MKILGISCYYHDSAAAIIVDNQIIAAVQEERFTRVKHTPIFPSNSIKYCLEETGLEISELDAIVFYDKPIVKFERLLSTFYEVSPKGLIPFIKSIPISPYVFWGWHRTLDEHLSLLKNSGYNRFNIGEHPDGSFWIHAK